MKTTPFADNRFTRTFLVVDKEAADIRKIPGRRCKSRITRLVDAAGSTNSINQWAGRAPTVASAYAPDMGGQHGD